MAGSMLLVACLALGSSHYAIQYWPQLHGPKNRYLTWLNLQSEYDAPTVTEPVNLSPISKPAIPNQRESLEDRVAQLIITKNSNIEKHFPGGVLLTKQDTRKGHLFGKHPSYDPERTQAAVEDILEKAKAMKKRVLIFDEGEGGFVMRVGTLPAAFDIGNYYQNNVIAGTLTDRVTPSANKSQRAQEVYKLFDEYAKELRSRGVDVVLGPVLDVIWRNQSKNIITRDNRSFGYKHSTVREIAELYINAMHKYGVKVIGKHFLGIGIPKEGDIHEEEVGQTKRIIPRVWAMNLYKRFRNDLDGVLVTHLTNPSDNGTPYSVSQRSLDALTKPTYADGTRRGVNFNGLVIVDDLSMKALLRYVERKNLNPRESRLLSGCTTSEAKAAVLTMDAGAHVVIALSADTDAIVKGVTHAYHADRGFKVKAENALMHYNDFASK